MPDSMNTERVVVICPGRGTYTKETLGYLRRFRPRFDALIAELDEARGELGQPSLSALDGADTFSPSLHLRGEHASALIFACAYADFLSLDRDRYLADHLAQHIELGAVGDERDHDFRVHLRAGLAARCDRCFENGARLHLGDFGILDA